MYLNHKSRNCKRHSIHTHLRGSIAPEPEALSSVSIVELTSFASWEGDRWKKMGMSECESVKQAESDAESVHTGERGNRDAAIVGGIRCRGVNEGAEELNARGEVGYGVSGREDGG
ncbi:hypothetical protein B0H14DRAFT_2615841 [Mycena olivaceomarginata]|nr:hypothetical protein B0H14DRAFT_2615841 [Mycena olivaceomarginata]